MEEILIEHLAAVFTSHGEKDITTNELMNHFTLCGHTLEDDILLIPQLDHHVSSLPVDIPSLKTSRGRSIFSLPQLVEEVHIMPSLLIGCRDYIPNQSAVGEKPPDFYTIKKCSP